MNSKTYLTITNMTSIHGVNHKPYRIMHPISTPNSIASQPSIPY